MREETRRKLERERRLAPFRALWEQRTTLVFALIAVVATIVALAVLPSGGGGLE